MYKGWGKPMKELLVTMRRWVLEMEDIGKGRVFRETVLPERLGKHLGILTEEMQRHEDEDDGTLVPEWKAILGNQPTIEEEEDLQIAIGYKPGLDAYTCSLERKPATARPRPSSNVVKIVLHVPS